MAEVHEDDRKLFCGALPQEAKDTDIKEFFSTFGEIDSVNLKMDPVTGRSRYTKGGGILFCVSDPDPLHFSIIMICCGSGWQK